MTGRFLFIRDLQVAEDIGARARLGWFDKEFNVFGTSFVQGGEQYYLISSNAERIYDILSQQLCQGIFCTPVETLVKKCPVPAGAEEQMAQEVKVLLGHQLQKQYDQAFLQDFQQSFSEQANDAAKPLLQDWQVRLDGLFDAQKLQLLALLANAARSAKVLTAPSYQELMDYLTDVYADMGDDPLMKDVYRRDLYSLTYWEKGHRRTVINAQKSRLYVKVSELSEKNILTTPIYVKTYWYNHDYRLSDARQDFEIHLQNQWITAFLDTADQINALPAAIESQMYQRLSQKWLSQYGPGHKRFLQHFAVKWHLHQN